MKSLIVAIVFAVAALIPGFGPTPGIGGSTLTVSSQDATSVLTLNPTADAYVIELEPHGNHGRSRSLLVDSHNKSGRNYDSYLRFVVKGVTGAIDSAKLRLYAYDGSVDGPAVHAASGDWSETGITWSSRHAPIGDPIDDTGAVAAHDWVEYDVTPAVRGDGDYSFVLVPTSGDGVDMYSREGSQPPQLVLTLGTVAATSTPTNTPEPTATNTPTPTMTAPPPSPTPTSAPPTGAGDPACSGYATPRWFFESQTWWQEPGVGYFDQPHVHLGTCFPHAETVSGDVPFDLVIKMHNNSGRLTHVRAGIAQDLEAGTQEPCGGLACVEFNPPLVCAQMDCTYKVRVVIPTQAVRFDGLQEFRFTAFVITGEDPTGSTLRMYQSSGWQAYLSNDKPVKHHDPLNPPRELVEGRGWHTDTEYTIARLNKFPKEPVSGTWTFSIKLTAGSGGEPVTEHEILIDPNIHAGSRGIVVKEGPGKFNGKVSIDTRTLPNGMRKLFLRAGAAVSTGTNSGIMVVPFMVQN